MNISSCQTVTIATKSAPCVFLGISLPEFVAELLAPLQTRLVSWALPRTAHWLRPGAPRAKVVTAIEPSNPVWGLYENTLAEWFKALAQGVCSQQLRDRTLVAAEGGSWGGCGARAVRDGGEKQKKNLT